MNGGEVNDLMKNRATLDDDKNIDQLRLKLHLFDLSFHNLEVAQVEKENIVEGRYAFIPFPCGAFIDLLIESYFILGENRSAKFLDIGCGLGSKVILACSLFDGYGIEINKSYVEKANILGLNRVGFADAFTFDRHNEFDILYYYRPIHDDERYREFEQLIYNSMKPGALVAPMHTQFEWDKKPDMERLTRFLYRKKLS